MGKIIGIDLGTTNSVVAVMEGVDVGAGPETLTVTSDHLGRDIYSRILHGARVSLLVGLGSTLVASVLGGIIGLLSGYVGGKTDLVAQRVMDILQGLPLLVLGMIATHVPQSRL